MTHPHDRDHIVRTQETLRGLQVIAIGWALSFDASKHLQRSLRMQRRRMHSVGMSDHRNPCPRASSVRPSAHCERLSDSTNANTGEHAEG